MTQEEREREKELKRLIYLRNEIIKEAKKELKILRNELNSLGNTKGKGGNGRCLKRK